MAASVLDKYPFLKRNLNLQDALVSFFIIAGGKKPVNYTTRLDAGLGLDDSLLLHLAHSRLTNFSVDFSLLL